MQTKERMKTFRLRLGWTQEQLAKRIERSRKTIQFYECGQRKPNFPTCFRLMQIAKENNFTDIYSIDWFRPD